MGKEKKAQDFSQFYGQESNPQQVKEFVHEIVRYNERAIAQNKKDKTTFRS